MKVLLTTIGHYCERPSGSARIAFDEALELRDRGEDVWMLGAGSPALPEHEIKEGIHLLRYAPPKVAAWHPLRGLLHQNAARSALERHLPEVDAIHGHIPLATVAALDLYGDRVHACYTIHSPARMEMAIEWRNSGVLRRMMAPVGLALINRIEAECLRRSSVITALSQYTIDCVRRIHGDALAERVKLIPGWADTSRFVPVDDRVRAKAQLGWPAEVPLLFTLRRLAPRMGLDRLLDACHCLVEEGFKFHLIIGGDGPMRGNLEQQAKSLGLINSVSFLGKVDDEILPLAYATCDAFVLPTSELECFGLIALEALSAGRPVLATSVGAIPEIIRNVDPAWLSRSSEAVDIADLLRGFLAGKLPTHSPEELHEYVCRNYSREFVLGKFIKTTSGGRKDLQLVG